MNQYFLNLIFIFFTLYSLHISASVKEILDRIPQEEVEVLKHLFTFLDGDHFAYTLFGDKPLSLSGDFTLTPWNNTLAGFSSGGVFWKRWEVWEKYKRFFPMKNYLLIKEPSKHVNSDNIILINKKEFIKIINKNLSLFQDILKKTIDPHELLSKLEKREITFRESIQDNELLWGILLGYGKHNAELYCRRLYCKKILSDKKKKSCYFGDYSYSPLIEKAVHFIADPDHSETIILDKKYSEMRRRISSIYAKGDFLEITLSKLTED